jgi:CheY-like chemotaxis protein
MTKTPATTSRTVTSTSAPAPQPKRASPLPAPAKPAAAPPAAHATRRILLVEDERIIRQRSTRTLLGAGYHVDAVGDAQSGWEAIQERSYDLLITDNRMAGLSGSELVLKLRSAQIMLPVIFASGGIIPEHVAAESQMQPVSALPKPFTPDELLALVAEVLPPAGLVPDGPGVSLHGAIESHLHWGINE